MVAIVTVVIAVDAAAIMSSINAVGNDKLECRLKVNYSSEDYGEISSASGNSVKIYLWSKEMQSLMVRFVLTASSNLLNLSRERANYQKYIFSVSIMAT